MKLSGLVKTLGLSLVPFAAIPVAAGGPPNDPVHAYISVFADAPISLSVIDRAEEKASQILQNAGVEVIWLNCFQDQIRGSSLASCHELSFSPHFDLRIVRSSRNLNGSSVGISFFASDGQGCCADLFYGAIERLQQEADVAPAVVLGFAMAHELGHLLLGVNAHAPIGLMRAHWARDDLRNAARGSMWFSAEQSLRMKRHFLPQPGQEKRATQRSSTCRDSSAQSHR
jgi:hypothetical protein